MWRTLKENLGKYEAAGEISVREFLVALECGRVNREQAARQLRDVAIRAYTMGAGLDRRTLGYLYTEMNRALREITKLASLKDSAIRGAMRVALEKCGLWPYADLLMDLVRKLDPSSSEAQTLYRQQELDAAALERLRGLKNGVIAFTSFTSFTDNRERLRAFPGNVVWELQSSRRMKVGDLSEFADEEECLLSPGSAVQIVRVHAEDATGCTVVEVRDLPLLKGGPERLWTGRELLEVPLASDLKLEGREGFGFVASEGWLDLSQLSRVIDADERLRRAGTQTVDAVFTSLPDVIDGLEVHGRATGSQEIEEACEMFCEMFRDAFDERRRAGPATKLRDVCDAALSTSTVTTAKAGYLFRDLNRGLGR
jgi:hypothetical protein